MTQSTSIPLIVDNFAGGGGASTGIEKALGCHVDIAINHDPIAIAMHRVNHPHTTHYCESVWDIDPVKACKGRPVGLAWFSPDCTHFSKAKGGKPLKKQIRGLAWIVLKWAATVRPRIIMLENVEEFCFPPETAILTKRGVIPIGDVQIGDEVWTHNARWKPVTAISRRKSNTVNIAGYGNSIVETTPNHQFYVRQYAPKISVSGKYGRHNIRLLEPEWVRADRLIDHNNSTTYSKAYSGYAWASPIELPKYWQRMPKNLNIDIKSPEFFYMIGRWLGDGWIRKRKGRQNIVRICAHKKEADKLETRLKRTGLSWYRSSHTENVDVFDLSAAESRILIPWLKHNFNEYAHLKTLPAWIYGSEEKQKRLLLQGYCDADGHEQSSGKTAIITVSRCLAIGIRLLLHSLDIPASISKKDSRTAISIVDRDKTINCRTAYTVSWKTENIWGKGHKIGLHLFGRVREVKPARKKVEVVDITVADDHSFIADGQVVHNCTWGPLIKKEDGNHYPCPKRKGQTFNAFINALKRHGYAVEWRELRACDYGAPTIRKRLFLIARCDGLPIIWPEPTHGDPKSDAVKSGRLKPWRTAAECIDWSIPCPSIFERKKPLAEATQRRIAKGIMKYVINTADPFIVTYYGAKGPEDFRGQPINEPIRTQTTENRHALVTPHIMPGGLGKTSLVSAFLAKHYGNGVVGSDLKDPIGTVTSIDHHSLVVAHLASHFGQGTGSSLQSPVRTITSKDKYSLITSHIVKLKGTNIGHDAREPLHNGKVRAFLMKYYGNEKQGIGLRDPLHTVTTKDRFGLVTVHGEEYQIVDIGLRMLIPRELFRAQGFSDSYIIDRDIDGKPITKTEQVAKCGNSVPPDLAEALVRANAVDIFDISHSSEDRERVAS